MLSPRINSILRMPELIQRWKSRVVGSVRTWWGSMGKHVGGRFYFCLLVCLGVVELGCCAFVTAGPTDDRRGHPSPGAEVQAVVDALLSDEPSLQLQIFIF